jgi:hypothetical protein
MAFGADVLDTLPPENLPQILPKMHDGDILLCSARDPFSRLIGWSTKSPWSHVAIAYSWPSTGRVLAFECVQQLGVHAVSLTRFISETSTGTHPFPGRIILARHRDTPSGDALRPLANFAINAMGDRFSPMEIARIGARIALSRLDLHMPEVLSACNEFICSEYVAKCFEAVGIRIAWDGLGFIAPGDFALDPQVDAVAQFKTR